MRFVANNNPHMVDIEFVDAAGAVHEIAVMPKSKCPIKNDDWQPVSLPEKTSMVGTPVADQPSE